MLSPLRSELNSQRDPSAAQSTKLPETVLTTLQTLPRRTTRLLLSCETLAEMALCFRQHRFYQAVRRRLKVSSTCCRTSSNRPEKQQFGEGCLGKRNQNLARFCISSTHSYLVEKVGNLKLSALRYDTHFTMRTSDLHFIRPVGKMKKGE